MFEAVVMTITAVFFGWISKDYWYLVVGNLALAVPVTLGIFLLPESPRYLISKDRFREAEESFKRISYFNRGQFKELNPVYDLT